MRKVLILAFTVFLFSCSKSSSQEIRKPAVAGAFYPGNKTILKSQINEFLDNVEKSDIEGRILAVIVPHAGYVYSGQVAAYSFKELQGRKVNSVVIICNAHSAHFPGIAIDGSDMWQTPLGLVELDKELAHKLVTGDEIIKYNNKAHRDDHTLEVQLPFLQTLLKGDFKITPILFGNTESDSYKRLA